MQKITLVLHNIRSTYNVGAILRTAEGLGVFRVVLSGYTPRYEDTGLLPHLREKQNRQIAKSALGAETLVSQESVADLPTWLETARSLDRKIIGLENNLSPTEQAKRLILGSPDRLPTNQAKTAHFWRAAEMTDIAEIILILGEEVSGIPENIRQHCDYFLEIPMHGRKESFNVSVATGIAIWGLQNT